MADAAISSVVKLLGNLLIKKVISLRGVEGKVRLLKDELKSMQSFLRDANRREAKEERVRDWIRELREIAFDAEDTIEMFLINVENVKSRGLPIRFTSFPKRMHHLDQIGDEIDSIRARLVTIHKRRVEYEIQIIEAGIPQVELRRRLCPWQKDEHLVGTEDAVKKVLRKSILDKEKRGLSVAVIQGMGGIGKSTLAREIYNHPEVVRGPFYRRGWVVVSSEFTPQETTKQIILQLSRSEEEKNILHKNIQKLEQSMKDKQYLLLKLKEMLYKQLEGTNYFIVMDDVWEQQHWDSFDGAFPNQQDQTSRLILTTRNKIITKHDQYEHKMKLLDSEKSWELFLKKAFINSTIGTCPEELQSIGRQILKKCNGLPLAISVIGGLLAGAQDESRWQQVLDQIDSDIPENNIPNILGLSYQNLSPQLKSCFLCLAFFKEDSTIPSNEVARIWRARGLIQKKGNRSIEDIGRGYLNELINRSMLQIQDLTVDGRVKSFRLHDLLRDVCLSKAEEEMGVKIVKGGEGGCSYKPRHLVYNKSFESFSSNENKYLHSVFLFNVGYIGVDISSREWKNFQLLKILYLDGFWFKKFPNSFRGLVGLKYLRIDTYRSRVYLKLPSWFSEFKKLEFLYVEYVEFGGVALKMESLRDFGARSVRGRAMKVENWKRIESLKGIRLLDWVGMSSGLPPDSDIRELGINIETGKEDNADLVIRGSESLRKMTNLVKLRLTYEYFLQHDSCTFRKFISNLKNLTSLTLIGNKHVSKCPAASVFPPNLTHLTLSKMMNVSMEELGKLPKLQYLTIKHWKISGSLYWMEIFHGQYPCLKALSLKNISRLVCIIIKEGGMPCLEQIRIRECPNLWHLPKHIIIHRF
ncbi:putative disease resistance RPP13-like protein 3 [Salvia hispanica]|uniref:putative disease resistance RPP13-like protein 3 n=1 Tax=Salvia hispanica TaxID=49212 RepID=UPI0020094F9D|nr:putative disease resistance RPP13-like protein 3 [Salvia hispanica]